MSDDSSRHEHDGQVQISGSMGCASSSITRLWGVTFAVIGTLSTVLEVPGRRSDNAPTVVPESPPGVTVTGKTANPVFGRVTAVGALNGGPVTTS